MSVRTSRRTSSATADFFAELGRRRHQPSVAKAKGTIRFDLADGTRTERWLVAIDRGNVSVSRKNAAADCVVRTTTKLFEAMLQGRANAMASYLRGEVTFAGDLELLVLIQRLFPGTAG